ncbi:YvrJ family protein (plasmid) [Lactobacillus sp. PV037]|nr:MULTISPECIES: YvrJ family protein [unclassified Lactobacillus]QNQ82921.1 YvrJ family protein [Lactobacillus sp. PV012]QNQ83025.1 YvrJ family protein [Lactobacillus sp. PV037]
MTQEIMKYVLEQASGVVIALMLIIRIESKLDGLTAAIMRLSETKSEDRV